MRLKTLLISAALCLLSLPGMAAPFTYPAGSYIDDTGAKVTPTSVTVASITTKAGFAIGGATATANIAGSNASVDYDAALYGEAYVTLTPVLAGHTFATNPPVAFGSLDSGNVQLIKSTNVVGTGTVTSATTPTTLAFSTTLTSATDLISGDGGVWTSGVNTGKVFHVLTNSSGLFTVAGTGQPTAPSNGDNFVLFPFNKALVNFLTTLGTDSKPVLSSTSTQPAMTVGGFASGVLLALNQSIFGYTLAGTTFGDHVINTSAVNWGAAGVTYGTGTQGTAYSLNGTNYVNSAAAINGSSKITGRTVTTANQ